MLIRTSSKRLIVATISANLYGIGRKNPGHDARLCGHDNHTAVCGSHSAGMRNPSEAGVALDFAFEEEAAAMEKLKRTVDEALREVTVRIDTAVSKERPMRARHV